MVWPSSLTYGVLRELSVAQLVGFLVVKPAHPGLSPRLDIGARIFLDLFQDLMVLFFQW
jgi:hypothetical protein